MSCVVQQHQYSISLQMVSDPYNIVYNHYNSVRFQSTLNETNSTGKRNRKKQQKKMQKQKGFVKMSTMNGSGKSGKNRTNIHGPADDVDHVVHLGMLIGERAYAILRGK